jgi:hypothetical protein
MMPPFRVRTTTHYERLSDQLLKRHPEFESLSHRVREILATDPYNRTRAYHIKKLEGIAAGQGPWRLSLGRFRYDITGSSLELVYCGLRREDTYR